MSKRTPSQKNNDASKRPKLEFKPYSRIQQPMHDLWGDDDDDEFIIIASQQLMLSQASLDLPNLEETSYNAFSKGGNLPEASTQVPQPSTSGIPPPVTNNDQDAAVSMLQDVENIIDLAARQPDDYFDDEDQSPPFYSAQGRQQERNERNRLAGITGAFKAPIPPRPAPVVKPPPPVQPLPSTSQNKPSRAEYAKDVKINFLQNHLAQFRTKHDLLEQVSSKTNDKLQVKEGEASMLRYELNKVKKQNDELRLQKLTERDTARNDLLDRITEMEREMRKQQVQLDFKNLEITNAKRSGLTQSFREVKDVAKDEKEAEESVKIVIPKYVFNKNPMINPKIFTPAVRVRIKPYPNPMQDSPLVTELTNFQTLLGLLDSPIQDELERAATVQTLFLNAKKLGLHFLKFTKTLKVLKDDGRVKHPWLECKFFRDNRMKNFIVYCPPHIEIGSNIFEKAKMFLNEFAPELRRILAAIVIVGQQSPEFCNQLSTVDLLQVEETPVAAIVDPDVIVIDDDNDKPEMPKKVLNSPKTYSYQEMVKPVEDVNMDVEKPVEPKIPTETLEMVLSANKYSEGNTFLDLLSEGLRHIGYTKQLYDFFGIATASAEVLTSVSRNFPYNYESREQLRSTINLLKAIVFCRPDNLYPTHAISKFLNQTALSKDRRQVLNFFCHNSNSQICFIENEEYRIAHFSNGSCVFQVLGGLIEVSAPQHKQQNSLELMLLYKSVCYISNFLRCCTLDDATWASRFLKEPEAYLCNCYPRMVCGFVAQFHLLFKRWLEPYTKVETVWMQLAAQSSVLALSDIFQKNYRQEVLAVAGSQVKTYLKILHSWLNQYQTELEFRPAHKRALGKIDLMLLLPDFQVFTEEDENDELITLSEHEADELLEESFKLGLC